MIKVTIPAAAWKWTGATLASFGVLLVLAGAGTNDLATATGASSLFDGIALAITGFLFFAAGVLILIEKG